MSWTTTAKSLWPIPSARSVDRLNLKCATTARCGTRAISTAPGAVNSFAGLTRGEDDGNTEGSQGVRGLCMGWPGRAWVRRIRPEAESGASGDDPDGVYRSAKTGQVLEPSRGTGGDLQSANLFSQAHVRG